MLAKGTHGSLELPQKQAWLLISQLMSWPLTEIHPLLFGSWELNCLGATVSPIMELSPVSPVHCPT